MSIEIDLAIELLIQNKLIEKYDSNRVEIILRGMVDSINGKSIRLENLAHNEALNTKQIKQSFKGQINGSN